jgi:hypothetical protein
MEKILNLEEILNQAKSRRYYRTADYNRQYALTLFVKELEKQAKEKNKFFQIITTHTVLMQCRHIKPKNINDWPIPDPETEISSLEFCRFAHGKEVYYIQFDNNPFFEAYIKRYSETTNQQAYKEPELHEIETGHIRIFNDIPIDTVWKYNGMENINELKNHLLEKFDELNKKAENYFWKSHKKTLTQTIYVR